MSNPEEIREDIERTRADLGQDVDALADKVSPNKIAERQGRKVRNAVTSLKDRVMGAASDATDGGLELTAYPKVREWLARVAAQPNYVQLLTVPNKAAAA